MILLADRNSPANVWLRENPLVLSAIAGLIGVALVGYGVVGLISGTTRDKHGNQQSGAVAALSSIVRLILGIGAIGFAIYVAIFGAW